jgi:nitrogen PTS system EIIA component
MTKTAASNTLNFSSFFSPEDIICQTNTTERDEIIRQLLEQLALNRGIGNVNKAFKAVIQREEVDPTVLSSCLALPHARLDSISALTVAIATSKQGIDFHCASQQKIHVVVLVLVPKDQPSLYLQALSSLARICQNEGVFSEIAKLQTGEEVWRFFDRGGLVLPDHVCAHDIMSSEIIKLKDNDTLARAIDLFIEHDLIDLPVVDKDDDLVGVVAAKELLRVCLPDYILWMDDLSPILHFEPFANVLANEGITWLAEIMSQNYATVGEDAPAIQVAQEMTKKNTQQVYVLNDKKLVGVVTLPHFLNKVLRD